MRGEVRGGGKDSGWFRTNILGRIRRQIDHQIGTCITTASPFPSSPPHLFPPLPGWVSMTGRRVRTPGEKINDRRRLRRIISGKLWRISTSFVGGRAPSVRLCQSVSPRCVPSHRLSTGGDAAFPPARTQARARARAPLQPPLNSARVWNSNRLNVTAPLDRHCCCWECLMCLSVDSIQSDFCN